MNSQQTDSGHRASERSGLVGLDAAFQQGSTLLLVEDSRLISDAIRLMLRGSGGRLRRADTLCRARRHLSLYTPDVVIIDLGLPDGSGLELICEIARRHPPVPLILAISGQTDLEADALAAGADTFLAKPIVSIAQFRGVLDAGCGGAQHLASAMHDPGAVRDDLYLALDLLQGPDQTDRLRYALQFVEGLARSLHDPDLLGAVDMAKAGSGTRQLVATLRQRLRDQPLI